MGSSDNKIVSFSLNVNFYQTFNVHTWISLIVRTVKSRMCLMNGPRFIVFQVSRFHSKWAFIVLQLNFTRCVNTSIYGWNVSIFCGEVCPWTRSGEVKWSFVTTSIPAHRTFKTEEHCHGEFRPNNKGNRHRNFGVIKNEIILRVNFLTRRD